MTDVNEEIIEEIDDSDCLDIESADENNCSKKIVSGRDGWSNTELTPKDIIKCFIPKSLFLAVKSIEASVNKKFTSKNEFSIYIHGEFNDDGDIVVSEEYYIPKQVVGPASVDYLEPPVDFYNGCLHKHPDGCKAFSGTDKNYINCNFDFSLLYVCHNISLGIVNIKYHGNKRLQTKLQIVIEDEELDDISIDNVMNTDPNKKVEIVKPATNLVGPGMFLPGFGVDDDSPQVILPTSCYPNLGDLGGFDPESDTDIVWDV